MKKLTLTLAAALFATTVAFAGDGDGKKCAAGTKASATLSAGCCGEAAEAKVAEVKTDKKAKKLAKSGAKSKTAVVASQK